jgi:hypothetical protein
MKNMSIPNRAIFFWGRTTAFPYVRYLTLATCRLQHPDWPLYLYQCRCNNLDKWGAVFQDFQFNSDELRKIYDKLAKGGVVVPDEYRQAAYDILLGGNDPAPWDRVFYDNQRIENILRENSTLDNIKIALNQVRKDRESREAKRPRKHDYIEDCVKRLGVELREYEPADERTYTMPPPNVSDIFSVEVLGRDGGWYFDCDQLILKALDNYGPKYDFICGGQTAFYIGVFGSRPAGKVVQDFYSKMIGSYSPEFYNSTGISAITAGCINNDEWVKWFKTNGEVNHITSQETFYPLCAWDGAKRFWGGDFDIEHCASLTCHYFGGHSLSQQMFREITPENILTYSENCMTRYVRKITNNGNALKKIFCWE